MKKRILNDNDDSLTNSCEELWLRYKTLRNSVNANLAKSKSEYLKKEIHKNKNNVYMMWKCLKSVLPNKSSSFPSIIYDKDIVYDDDYSIANAFNDYFIQINLSPVQELTAEPADDNCIFSSCSTDHVFEFINVEEDYVLKLLANLDRRKATGSDDIDITFLKLSKSYIAPSITQLINLSLSKGIFPDDCKYAKVFPLYKKGDANCIRNFRPISILPAISKLIEKAVHKQLYDYLVKYNILNKAQFGFRPGHSTSSALACLTDDWLRSIDDGFIVGALFIDLRRAFDTVNTAILLNKLKTIGLSTLSLSWFSSYLNNRKQYVTINNCKSNDQNLSIGVPQGSILGPLLF